MVTFNFFVSDQLHLVHALKTYFHQQIAVIQVEINRYPTA